MPRTDDDFKHYHAFNLMNLDQLDEAVIRARDALAVDRSRADHYRTRAIYHLDTLHAAQEERHRRTTLAAS